MQPVEAVFTQKRALQLEDHGITGKFDIAHLQDIHRHLFQDVFPWAGEFRVVNMSKGNSNFGPAIHLAGALGELLAKLKAERFLVGLTPQTFATRAAFYLGEINAIHPFREGNGRTPREFIRQLAIHAAHPLSWAGFTQQQMVDASVASMLRGDYTGLTAIIKAALFSSRERSTAP